MNRNLAHYARVPKAKIKKTRHPTTAAERKKAVLVILILFIVAIVGIILLNAYQ